MPASQLTLWVCVATSKNMFVESMGHSENIYKPKILVSSQNHALQVGISKPWVFKSHSVEERLTWRPLISQRFFNAFAHLAECIIMFVVRHVTQDLKFDRPIVHNRYDFDSLGFWIFDIRYLRDYWELWTPVTHALVLHAEMFISGSEEWKYTSERDSTYPKNKLRFGSPIRKLSWTKHNSLCPK